MQLARRLDFEDADTLFYVRVSYVVAQLVCLAVYYYCTLKIKKINDTTIIKYVAPKSPFQQEPGEMLTTTVRDYDLTETSTAVRGVLMGAGMMAFMHFYLNYTQPLFIQSILPIKGLYDSKIVKLHILGRPATGELKRPFEATGFGSTPAAATAPAAALKEKKTN